MNILWIMDKQLDTAFDIVSKLGILKYLQEHNNLILFCRYKNNKVQFKNIKNEIHYFKSSRIPYISRIISYREQIKKYEYIIKKYMPDIVLFNTGNFFLIQKSINLKSIYNYKLILDVRSLVVDPNPVRRLLNELFFRNTLRLASSGFDGITYITEEMRNYCQKKYKLHKHKSCVWSSGVDINLLKPTAKNDCSNNQLKLIYHGTVASNRGIQNIVRALIRLKSEYINFSILGGGEGVEKLKKLIRLNALSKTVKILDSVPYEKVPSIINKFDIGILSFPNWPGWNTSSPIKLFEYLACGLPVIATKIPAHTNVLRDKNFVIWADSASPEDIAKAIMVAYKKREQFAEIGREARKFVTDNYTWEKQAQKLDLFLKNL